MTTRSVKAMLSQMKLTDEVVGVVVANYGQGLITIGDFSQLNEKYVEGLFWVLQIPGETTAEVSNTGVAVSEMSEDNIQGMIYYIKHFKSIGYTCMHANVELSKVRPMYHQLHTEEANKNPEVVPTMDPKYWPKTLEQWKSTLEDLEEYIKNISVTDLGII